MQVGAVLETVFKQESMISKGNDVFVVSKIGQQFGGKHYFAYHDHYNTENGRVNHIVIPFDSDAERRKETMRRAVIQAILNPAGDGWY